MFKKILDFFRRSDRQTLLADSSIFEDGRILNIVKSNFANIKFIVPQFVIDEMQRHISSKNSIKRERAKRGIGVISKLKDIPDCLQITNKDFKDIKEHNAKITALSKHFKARIFTADFKLNKAALMAGVKVLNLDAVAKAFKQIYLPGETLMIFLAKEGAQNNQAVGYLDDGTMVIAEESKKFIGKRVELLLTSIMQSSSGMMIFGKVSDNYLEQINEMYKKSANRQ
ncbi:MAG: hypothetical protein LBV66_02850 [Elusimicrobiota bacterium]|jgi:uncharacterized protein YacL|nr:hypothetical protein [Elusimicrobiota bacterium]